MLVQINSHKQIINVHLEQMQGTLLDKLGREDRQYVQIQISDCVDALIEKFHIMYTKRMQ